MPIDIKIDGDPDSIRHLAHWMRSRLSDAVHDGNGQAHRARSGAEAGWHGTASDAFQTTMRRTAPKGDELARDADRVGRGFERCADDLQTAQAHMERAKQIALNAGLEVTATQILDPPPTPAPPLDLPPNPSPQVQQAHDNAVATRRAHASKAAAYSAAQEEANTANTIRNELRQFVDHLKNEFGNKGWLHASDYVNNAGAAYLTKKASSLSRRAGFWSRLSKLPYEDIQRGRADVRMSRTGKLVTPMDRAGNLEKIANSHTSKAGTLTKVANKALPSGAFAVVGVGFDIYTGKSPAKAVFSGGLALGAVAATPAGWGALAAVGVGVGVGFVADQVWDHAIPDNVKDKLNAGAEAVGEGIAEGAKATGQGIAAGAKAVGDTVSGAWDAVF